MAAETIRSESSPTRETPGALSYGDAFGYAKERIPTLVLERLDLPIVMQVPGDELPSQIGEIVTEILLDLQVRLNGPEHGQILNLVIGDIMAGRTKVQNKKVESGPQGSGRVWARGASPKWL